MNYREFTEAEQKRYNDFASKYIFYAFSDKQFIEGMKAKGLDPETDKDKVYSMFGGGFYKKEDAAKVREMFQSLEDNRKKQIEADTTGEGFIYEMFLYELNNHEYSYTGDMEDTLNALGLTVEEINANEALLTGLHKAIAEIEAYEEE